jgi:hypothetical protein
LSEVKELDWNLDSESKNENVNKENLNQKEDKEKQLQLEKLLFSNESATGNSNRA